MKTLTAFAVVLIAASQLSAQTADKPTVITAADLKPADPKAPAVKPPAKKEVKKPEPVYVIPGQTIARDNGTFLGLQVVDDKFKLSFYDAKKKPMVPDVSRVAVRWPNPRAIGDNHDVLRPNGAAFIGSRTVFQPYSFNLTLVLLQGEDADTKTVQAIVVPFHG